MIYIDFSLVNVEWFVVFMIEEVKDVYVVYGCEFIGKDYFCCNMLNKVRVLFFYEC